MSEETEIMVGHLYTDKKRKNVVHVIKKPAWMWTRKIYYIPIPGSATMVDTEEDFKRNYPIFVERVDIVVEE